MNNIKKIIRKHLNIISIIFCATSIVIFAINLFGRIGSWTLTTIGCCLTTMGIIFTLYDENNKPRRGFEVVRSDKRKSDYYHIPTRSTTNSAGYDFYCDKNYEVKPNEIIKIWTDIKAYMQSDEFLMLDVRSSMGGKFMLANTIGIVDSDYYENPTNDGNICFMLKNISNEVQHIEKDNKIGQGIFMKYLKIDNDNTTTKRNGGLGSSGK
jgi:dUTP pyrophosphatase